MLKKTILLLTAGTLLAPLAVLLGIAVLLNPAVGANCLGVNGAGWSSFASASVSETSRIVFPLPKGSWVSTSGFGTRIHPITGVRNLHTGSDFAAKAGTPIHAAADGRVSFAGPAAGYGRLILIEHTVGGKRVASGYAHMYAGGVLVKKGQRIVAGQRIGLVGSSGNSTGPHLHFEIRPGGSNAAPINPVPWLRAHGAADLASAASGSEGCPGATVDAAAFTGVGNQLVDDPTTNSRITARTANVLAQIRRKFPQSSWSCFRPDKGLKSEHALGRACDGTFGNRIGQAARGHTLSYGWQVTNWVKTNARTLGVEYVIWQGKIWSVRRASEGWRAYNGGGMFDPRSITGGHFDHLHVTLRSGGS